MIISNDIPIVAHWSLENGYTKGTHEKSYPIRVSNVRQNAALYFYLQIYENDIEYICRNSIKGYKVFLHTPGEVLKNSWPYFRAGLFEQQEISIKPTLLTTSKGLHYYQPNQRRCFFNSERRLRFFKVYTKNNCELECLSNFTRDECGCVKFSMPSNMNCMLFLYTGYILIQIKLKNCSILSLVSRRRKYTNLWYFIDGLLCVCRKEIVWGRN